MTEPTPRLYLLGVTLVRSRADGSTDVKQMIGYRIAIDGEDAVVGRFVRTTLDDNAGYALSGRIGVLEVPREDLIDHMKLELLDE